MAREVSPGVTNRVIYPPFRFDSFFFVDVVVFSVVLSSFSNPSAACLRLSPPSPPSSDQHLRSSENPKVSRMEQRFSGVGLVLSTPFRDFARREGPQDGD